MSKMNSITAFASKATITIAATGAWVSSAGFNALAGQQMGEGDTLLVPLWITAAVSLDLLKAGAATTIVRKHVSPTVKVAAFVLVGVATSVSLLSALSLRTMRASTAAATAKATTDSRADLKATVRASVRSLEGLGRVRSLDQIGADIAGVKQLPRWTRSSGCTDATEGASIKLCNRYRSLQREKAKAVLGITLNSRVLDARDQLAKLPVSVSLDQGSPVAVAVATYASSLNLGTYDAKTVDQWILIFFTVSIELGAVLGPLVAAGGAPVKQLAKPKRWTKAQQMGEPEAQLVQHKPIVNKQVVQSSDFVKVQLVQMLRRSGSPTVAKSRAKLASELGTSKSTIGRVIQDLVAAGTISAVPMRDKNKGTRLALL